MSIKTYSEFIAEGKKGLTNAGSIMKTDNIAAAQTAINLADDSLENLRRKLLDKFFAKTDDKERRDIINKCVSTCVYALDKKLRLEEDIIEKLADSVNMDSKEVRKILSDEVDAFYGSTTNLYGQTS